MNELYKEYPFKSPKKFIPIAIEHGYTKQEAIDFLDTITHDHKFNPREYYLPSRKRAKSETKLLVLFSL